MGGAPSVSRLRLVATLALGILAVSSAAPIIRIAQAPALTVAAWRLGLSALILIPVAVPRVRAEHGSWPAGTWRLLIVSGLCLGLHFAFWIRSLDLTSVASSVLLVTTNPIWTGIAAHFVLGERLRGLQVVGIAAAMCGAFVIGGGDAAPGRHAFSGDALALAGAWMASAYFLMGRVARRSVSLLAYIGVAYSVAAVALVALALAFGAPLLGISARTAVCVAALALGPQLLGHSTFNWALRYVPATVVAVVVLGEPIGASLLAALLLHEPPSTIQIAGGALVILGIALTVRAGRASPEPAA